MNALLLLRIISTVLRLSFFYDLSTYVSVGMFYSDYKWFILHFACQLFILF
jgi:hypothetical protein